MALSIRTREDYVKQFDDMYNSGEYIPEKIRKAKIEYLKNAENEIGEQVWAHDERSAALSKLQLGMILVMAGICLVMLLAYIFSASSNSMLKTKVEQTRKTYFDLVSENSQLENEIEKGVNYTAVYDYAINTLGMVYPEKKQIMNFTNNNHEYVVKGESIPEY